MYRLCYSLLGTIKTKNFSDKLDMQKFIEKYKVEVLAII